MLIVITNQKVTLEWLDSDGALRSIEFDSIEEANEFRNTLARYKANDPADIEGQA